MNKNTAFFATAALLIGALLVALGSWMIYPPAGYIVGGVLLGACGVISVIGGSDHGNDQDRRGDRQ